jgi:hypothetical protein
MKRSAELGRVGFQFARNRPEGSTTGPWAASYAKRAFIACRKEQVKPSKVGTAGPFPSASRQLRPEMGEAGQSEFEGNVLRYFQMAECFDMMTKIASGALFFRGRPRHSSVAQWQSIRLLTGGL